MFRQNYRAPSAAWCATVFCLATSRLAEKATLRAKDKTIKAENFEGGAFANGNITIALETYVTTLVVEYFYTTSIRSKS